MASCQDSMTVFSYNTREIHPELGSDYSLWHLAYGGGVIWQPGLSSPNDKIHAFVPLYLTVTRNQNIVTMGHPSEMGGTSPRTRVWAVVLALSISSLLVALEGTVVATALPAITRELDAGYLSVWLANSYFVSLLVNSPHRSLSKLTDTSAAFQPLHVQFSGLLGRKFMLVLSIIVFALGSVISGVSARPWTLIAGRVVQGTGGAGIGLLTHLIITDLVPLRQVSRYMGIIFMTFAVGTALGPVVGGTIVQHASWRWVFFINIPVSAVAIFLVWIFLAEARPRIDAWMWLAQIDFLGTFLLTTSVTAMLVGISFGTAQDSWSSRRVIVPLVFGFVGLLLFYAYEASDWCRQPVLPFRVLLTNRTTTVALVLSFSQFLFSYWMLYTLPVYFQDVLLSSPAESGTLLLPTLLSMMPSSIAAGFLLSRLGRYKPLHIFATGLTTIGGGCCIVIDAETPVFVTVACQILMASGLGTLMSTLLPAVQAGLDPADKDAAAATWGLFRAMGAIWGVAIPELILNARQQHPLANVGKSEYHTRNTLDDGLDATEELVKTYAGRLRIVWITWVALSSVALLMTLLEKELPLSDSQDPHRDSAVERTETV